MDENRDDENVWRALTTVRELADMDEAPNGLSAGEAELRRLLMQRRLSTSTEVITTPGRITALLLRLSGRSPGAEACIDWLRSTGQFSEPELNLIRRAKIFYEISTGNVMLRQQQLSEISATSLLTLLTFGAGMWVGWVLFTENAGLQQIVSSLALGTVLGTLARIILDLSFRYARVREKILRVAPWFRDQGGTT
jgi:hypothetical protein